MNVGHKFIIEDLGKNESGLSISRLSIQILIDGNVSNVARIIGFLFCLVSILCLTYLFVKILLEKNPIVYNKN